MPTASRAQSEKEEHLSILDRNFNCCTALIKNLCVGPFVTLIKMSHP